MAWCPGPESNRHVPFGTRDFKLRRFAGVSEPDAERNEAEGERESAAEILSEAKPESKDLSLVPGAGIEPARPFRDSGF